MFTYVVDQLSVNVLNSQAVSGAGGIFPSTGNLFDLSNAVGPITVTVIDPGGTNTMTITPVMNTANSTTSPTPTNVPAAALIAQSGASAGLPATFATIAASASVQTLALVNELMQRYLALNLTGASLTHTVTVVVTFLKRYTQ